MTIAITRLDLTAAELRTAAERTQKKALRRILVSAQLLEGWSREGAAQTCAIDRQMLSDWAHRCNALELAGWCDRGRRNGPLSLRSTEQQPGDTMGVTCSPETGPR